MGTYRTVSTVLPGPTSTSTDRRSYGPSGPSGHSVEDTAARSVDGVVGAVSDESDTGGREPSATGGATDVVVARVVAGGIVSIDGKVAAGGGVVVGGGAVPALAVGRGGVVVVVVTSSVGSVVAPPSESDGLVGNGTGGWSDPTVEVDVEGDAASGVSPEHADVRTIDPATRTAPNFSLNMTATY